MRITLLAGDSDARIGALGALWRIRMDEVKWCVDCRWTGGIRASKSIFVAEKISGFTSKRSFSQRLWEFYGAYCDSLPYQIHWVGFRVGHLRRLPTILFVPTRTGHALMGGSIVFQYRKFSEPVASNTSNESRNRVFFVVPRADFKLWMSKISGRLRRRSDIKISPNFGISGESLKATPFANFPEILERPCPNNYLFSIYFYLIVLKEHRCP